MERPSQVPIWIGPAQEADSYKAMAGGRGTEGEIPGWFLVCLYVCLRGAVS